MPYHYIQQVKRLFMSFAQNNSGQNESENFICAITGEIMFDPVVTADGQSYEREVIVEWLINNNTSPNTNTDLPHKNLVPNVALKNAIGNYLITHPLEWN